MNAIVAAIQPAVKQVVWEVRSLAILLFSFCTDVHIVRWCAHSVGGALAVVVCTLMAVLFCAIAGAPAPGASAAHFAAHPLVASFMRLIGMHCAAQQAYRPAPTGIGTPESVHVSNRHLEQVLHENENGGGSTGITPPATTGATPEATSPRHPSASSLSRASVPSVAEAAHAVVVAHEAAAAAAAAASWSPSRVARQSPGRPGVLTSYDSDEEELRVLGGGAASNGMHQSSSMAELVTSLGQPLLVRPCEEAAALNACLVDGPCCLAMLQRAGLLRPCRAAIVGCAAASRLR